MKWEVLVWKEPRNLKFQIELQLKWSFKWFMTS